MVKYSLKSSCRNFADHEIQSNLMASLVRKMWPVLKSNNAGLDEAKKVLGYSLVVKIKQSAFVLSK